MQIGKVKPGTKVRIPVAQLALAANGWRSKEDLEGIVLDTAIGGFVRIGWKGEKSIQPEWAILNPINYVRESKIEPFAAKLDQSIQVVKTTECSIIAGSSSPGFLLALIGAGAVLSSLSKVDQVQSAKENDEALGL